MMLVFEPPRPLSISVTVLLPVVAYTCCTLVAVVLLVPPSPKLQNRLVIEPVEPSVNVTANGGVPFVGLPLKMAAGGGTDPKVERPSVTNSTGAVTFVVWPAVIPAITLDTPNISVRFSALIVNV